MCARVFVYVGVRQTTSYDPSPPPQTPVLLLGTVPGHVLFQIVVAAEALPVGACRRLNKFWLCGSAFMAACAVVEPGSHILCLLVFVVLVSRYLLKPRFLWGGLGFTNIVMAPFCLSS